MDFSFPRYLAAKRSVDDRALNRSVWQALVERLSALEGTPMLRVLELGGGIGTMFERMVEWGALFHAEYSLVDEQVENTMVGMTTLTRWGARQGLGVITDERRLFLHGEQNVFQIEFFPETVESFIGRMHGAHRWDLIVASAFLDLIDVPTLLPPFKGLIAPGGLLYLPLNFDGVTIFEPEIDPELDRTILETYHRTMDERGAGDSRTGRRLFHWLRDSGLDILEAGSSDWVVYPRGGGYASEEVYFLQSIFHFFEQSLRGRPEIDPRQLSRWLILRQEQVVRGELIFVAHQIDFLVQVP